MRLETTQDTELVWLRSPEVWVMRLQAHALISMSAHTWLSLVWAEELCCCMPACAGQACKAC